MLFRKYIIEFNLLRRLALPIIIGQLGVILMGVIDTIMIGQLIDKDALAAASLGNALSYLIGSLAFGGIPVIAPIFAQSHEQDKTTKLKTGFEAVLILSVFLTLLSLLIYFYFNVLEQPLSIEKPAKSYFLLITISNIPLFFFLVVKQLLDSSSKASVSMWITFVGLFVNAVLNYFLIKGLGPFQPMGLNGAGLGTIITRIVMLILVVSYLSKATREATTKHLFQDFKNKANEIFDLVKTILYAGVQVFFEIGAFAFAVIMMGWISNTALAAHQIAINIAAIMYMMATGVAYAAGIRVGNSLKGQKIAYAKIAGSVAFLLVFVMMLLSATFILVFKMNLVSLYIDNVEVQLFAANLLIIAAFFQVSDGIQAVALGCLRGLTDVKVPALLTFVAYWVISLPVGYLLCFKFKFGAAGIWYGLLIGLSLAAIFLVFRFYSLLSKRQALA